MYILFSSTVRRTDKGALDMRCDAALANYLFCSLSVISKLKLHTFLFSNFYVLICLTCGRSSSRAVLIGRREVRSLYWLVRLSIKAGSHAYALEQSNIAFTSQSLRLANLVTLSFLVTLRPGLLNSGPQYPHLNTLIKFFRITKVAGRCV